MKIIIAGMGKIGNTLAQQLTAEGHDLTFIDIHNRVLTAAVETFDAIGVMGNCASKEVLLDAGVETADLLIAATNADEVNLLGCMTAHGINDKIHTIARVRNPEYTDQIMTMPQVFPLSLTVNPERQAALEIERLLKYPGFLRRDTFAKGRAEIVELRVDGKSMLCNVKLMDMQSVVKCKVLVCAVLRGGKAVAPSGNFVLQEGDRIFVTAPVSDLAVLLKNLGIITRPVKSVLLCGGGRVCYYLASLLEKDRISVQILERNYTRCEELAGLLPQTSVACGDCSSQDVLESQGIGEVDALVALTGMDETNMVLSMLAKRKGVNQVITKLSRAESLQMADSMSLDSRISPRELCGNSIVRYVRAMQNQTGAAISVHAIADGQAEAVEFVVDNKTLNCNVTLKDMRLKPNVLIASITHGATSVVPNGQSRFVQGDRVVLVTSHRGLLQQMNDAFE